MYSSWTHTKKKKQSWDLNYIQAERRSSVHVNVQRWGWSFPLYCAGITHIWLVSKSCPTASDRRTSLMPLNVSTRWQLSAYLWAYFSIIKGFAVIPLEQRVTALLQSVACMLKYYYLPITILSICKANFAQEEGRFESCWWRCCETDGQRLISILQEEGRKTATKYNEIKTQEGSTTDILHKKE